MEEHIQQTRNY